MTNQMAYHKINTVFSTKIAFHLAGGVNTIRGNSTSSGCIQ
jgi:hypothetical protein